MRAAVIDGRLSAWPNGLSRVQSTGAGGWPSGQNVAVTYSPTGMSVTVSSAADPYLQTGGFDSVWRHGMVAGGTYRLHVVGASGIQIIYKSSSGVWTSLGSATLTDQLVTIPSDAQVASAVRLTWAAAGIYLVTRIGIFPAGAQPGWWQPGTS